MTIKVARETISKTRTMVKSILLHQGKTKVFKMTHFRKKFFFAAVGKDQVQFWGGVCPQNCPNQLIKEAL